MVEATVTVTFEGGDSDSGSKSAEGVDNLSNKDNFAKIGTEAGVEASDVRDVTDSWCRCLVILIVVCSTAASVYWSVEWLLCKCGDFLSSLICFVKSRGG